MKKYRMVDRGGAVSDGPDVNEIGHHGFDGGCFLK